MAKAPDVPTPIVVNPNPAGAMVGAAIRNITVLLAGGVAIIGFLSKHDINGLVIYLQSDGFVPVVGALSAIAAVAYSQWRVWKGRKALVTIATAAPDKVAIVQQPDPPPPKS